MKKLLFTLTIAAAIAASATPLTAHAKGMAVLSVNCGGSAGQNSSNGQWIVINDGEKVKEILQNLSEKCGINLDHLLQGSCPGGPSTDIVAPEAPAPEVPAPDETQPAPPAQETPAPDETQPVPPAQETPVPDETQPAPPASEDTEPALPPPTPSVPGTTAPDTQPPVSDSEDEETTPPTGSVHPYVLRIVELVNEERIKAGLNPVILDEAASNAALIRSKEIVSSFSHTRPNGSSFSTALKEQGISYRRAGENIAWGQRSPEQVMEGWMNSPGHRANILGESFTHIGVGYYQENGVNYWTQLFFG